MALSGMSNIRQHRNTLNSLQREQEAAQRELDGLNRDYQTLNQNPNLREFRLSQVRLENNLYEGVQRLSRLLNLQEDMRSRRGSNIFTRLLRRARGEPTFFQTSTLIARIQDFLPAMAQVGRVLDLNGDRAYANALARAGINRNSPTHLTLARIGTQISAASQVTHESNPAPRFSSSTYAHGQAPSYRSGSSFDNSSQGVQSPAPDYPGTFLEVPPVSPGAPGRVSLDTVHEHSNGEGSSQGNTRRETTSARTRRQLDGHHRSRSGSGNGNSQEQRGPHM